MVQVVGRFGMDGSNREYRRFFAGLIGITLACLVGWGSQATAAGSSFSPLKNRLIIEGYSRAFVNALYTRDLHLQLNTVAATMRIQESRLNYDQFLEPEAVRQAQRFIQQHRSILEQAQAQYGVEPYVIAGVLLVETRFGRVTGRTPVLAVLSTFALMEHESNRNLIWKRMRAKDRKQWTRQRFDSKLRQRAAWATKEVKALLRWFEDEPEKLKALRGSVMGAMGWPQFIPSSLVLYGVDGDGSGTVDLYQPADSIHSIANYLKAFGWVPGNDRENHRAALFQYNHSAPYVATILEVAQQLKQQDQAPVSS